jgi:hypothetical protein
MLSWQIACERRTGFSVLGLAVARVQFKDFVAFCRKRFNKALQQAVTISAETKFAVPASEAKTYVGMVPLPYVA